VPVEARITRKLGGFEEVTWTKSRPAQVPPISELLLDYVLYRPISARFPARAQASFGGSPMTLLSHQERRNARCIRNSVVIGLDKRSTLRTRQLRTKKEMMHCRRSGPSQYLRLACKLARLGECFGESPLHLSTSGRLNRSARTLL